MIGKCNEIMKIATVEDNDEHHNSINYSKCSRGLIFKRSFGSRQLECEVCHLI